MLDSCVASVAIFLGGAIILEDLVKGSVGLIGGMTPIKKYFKGVDVWVDVLIFFCIFDSMGFWLAHKNLLCFLLVRRESESVAEASVGDVFF